MFHQLDNLFRALIYHVAFFIGEIADNLTEWASRSKKKKVTCSTCLEKR